MDTQYEDMSIGARVMRGMAWIDGQQENGRSFDLLRVRTDGSFDMSNASRCVLGQAYHGPIVHAFSPYGESLWLGTGYSFRDGPGQAAAAERAQAWARVHGFLCLPGDMEDYNALTSAWRAAITARREAMTVR